MNNFWQKIKNSFFRGWTWTKTTAYRVRTAVYPTETSRVRPLVKYLGALVLIGLALLGTILYVRSRDDENNKDESPEIAQVYEPSIGTPLAPDTPGNPAERPGEVGGAVAPSATPTPVPSPATAPTSGVNLVAPNTGIDDDEPVKYSNDAYGFAATLPAGSNVLEKSGSVTFVSNTNARFYTVSVSPKGNETLATLEAQLKNSPSVKDIQSLTFNGIPALKFGSNESGNGIVFVNDGNIYYLLGNNQYFNTFTKI